MSRKKPALAPGRDARETKPCVKAESEYIEVNTAGLQGPVIAGAL